MNSLGQRTSITKNGLAYPAATVETVGYDSKGQVVKTTDNANATNNHLYTFDTIGNRLTSQDGSVGVSPASTYTVNAVKEPIGRWVPCIIPTISIHHYSFKENHIIFAVDIKE